MLVLSLDAYWLGLNQNPEFKSTVYTGDDLMKVTFLFKMRSQIQRVEEPEPPSPRWPFLIHSSLFFFRRISLGITVILQDFLTAQLQGAPFMF